ncbi:MAG: YidB family protein [Rhodomicrobium sp.]
MSSIFDVLSSALSEAMRQPNAPAQSAQSQMREPEPEQVQTGRPASAPASFSGILVSSGFGNLAGLVDQLSKGGLDQQVKSWLGNGENAPVNPDQLRNALGDHPVQNIGQQAGIPAERILAILAQYLPAAIDQASPNGKLQDPYKSTQH